MYESEELAKKRKLNELKKEITLKRKTLMEKFNNDIQIQIRNLNKQDLTGEEKKQIEDKI